MTLLFAGIALDMAQILGLVFFFFDYLGGINPSGWTVSLLAFVTFFRVLGLRLISSKKGMRLSLFPILGSLIAAVPVSVILVLLEQWMVVFQAPRIDFLNIEG